MKIDAKRVVKWSQNRCQIASIINVKTGRGKDEEHHKKNLKNDVREPWDIGCCLGNMHVYTK